MQVWKQFFCHLKKRILRLRIGEGERDLFELSFRADGILLTIASVAHQAAVVECHLRGVHANRHLDGAPCLLLLTEPYVFALCIRLMHSGVLGLNNAQPMKRVKREVRNLRV